MLKENRVPWRNGWFPGLGAENIKDVAGALCGAARMTDTCQKDSEAHLKELPLAKSGTVLTSKWRMVVMDYNAPNEIGIHESILYENK